MKDEQWTAELRRRMADYEQPAPDGLWESIKATLSEADSHIMTPPHRRHHLWRYAGAIAAAIVLLIFLFGYHNLHFNQLPSEHIYTTGNKPSTSVPTILHAADPYTDGHDTHHNIRPISGQAVLHSLTRHTITNTKSSVPDTTTQEIATKGYSGGYAETSVTESQNDSLPEKTSRPIPQNVVKSGATLLAVTTVSNRKTGNLSAGISISNLPRVTAKSHGYSGLVAGYKTTATAAIHELPEVGNPLCELMRHNLDKEIHTNTKHYQPIKVGISLCYSLNDRLDLESGLTYAYLVSSTTSGSNDYRFETNQKLHYIGLPLGVNYNLIQNKRFSLYISTGVTVEKCVAGKIDTDYINCGTVTKRYREHFRPKELQWSANIGTGVQYNITPGIGLYAEPGMSYYFKNGGSQETFYTRKPLKFSMEAGIRFSFTGK